MPREATFGELIELAYQGALDPERFNEFLRETARCIGAPSGNVQVFEPGTSNCLFMAAEGPNFTERVGRIYQNEFMHIEPYRKFVNREHLGSDRKVILCHNFIGEADTAFDPFFQEYVFPVTNSRWFAGNLSFDDPELAIQYGFVRLQDQTPFDEDARQTLEFLTPHLRRAVKISIGLGRTQNLAAALETAMRRNWVRIYLIDEQSRTVWMSSAPSADNPSGPLIQKGERLLARSPEAQCRFDRAVRDALNCAARSDAGDIDLPDETGRRCLVSVRPAGALSSALGGPQQARVMVLVAGSEPPPLAADKLARFYKLTAAEARLAVGLAEGLAVEEYAAQHKVSHHTIRSQLKSVFDKTGVRRQGQLISLVWRISRT